MLANIINGHSRRRGGSVAGTATPPENPYFKLMPAMSMRSRLSSVAIPPTKDLFAMLAARTSTRQPADTNTNPKDPQRAEAEAPRHTVARDDGVKGTILSRQYIVVMSASFIAYGLLHLTIRHSGSQTCNIDHPFSSWVHQVGIAVVACYALSTVYFLTCVSAMYSWSISADREETHVKAVFCASATIATIAGCATAIFLTSEGRFVCQGGSVLCACSVWWLLLYVDRVVGWLLLFPSSLSF
jgi:hypothetical protein